MPLEIDHLVVAAETLPEGEAMLTDLFRVRHMPQIPQPTGPIPVTTEAQRQAILQQEAEMQRRLDMLVAESEVPRRQRAVD